MMGPMSIHTSRFGTIGVEDSRVIHMPGGMLGFSGDKRYVIVRHNEKSVFFWLQSLDDPTLAFVIVNPLLFVPDYRIDLQAVNSEMAWDEAGTPSVYAVVNIPREAPEKMTMNLAGPIIVNHENREAVQRVFPDAGYSHRHPVLGPR